MHIQNHICYNEIDPVVAYRRKEMGMFLFFLENNIVSIILWLAVFLIALGTELSTTQLVSIWFSGGALVSLILACFNVHWIIQIAVFLIVSLLLLVLTRPFIRKRIHNPETKTNADSMIGSEILISKEVSEQMPGEGKFRDIVWTCKTDSGETISAGEFAIIKEIRGNSLIVTRKGKALNE